MAVFVWCGRPAPDQGLSQMLNNSLLNRRSALYFVVVGFLVAATAVSAEWQSFTGKAMGTEISVELWHPDSGVRQGAINAVMTEMERIDQTYSPWVANSELSRLNRSAASGPQALSDEMALLIQRALLYSKLTAGAFDITFASVGRLYDYRSKKKPSDVQRAALLEAVNFEHLDFNRREQTLAFKHPQVKVDLGGIAKGYAVDRAVALLKERGIEHASVSAGGDSRVLGDRRGRPWMIGIKKPRSLPGDDEPAILLPLDNVAVSTSGDYERYFIDPDSGRRIHHIINPRTGQSAGDVVSVTILGAQGIDTDALSTSVFVLGVDEGLKLVNGLPGFDSIIIDSSGTVHYSGGLMPPTENAS